MTYKPLKVQMSGLPNCETYRESAVSKVILSPAKLTVAQDAQSGPEGTTANFADGTSGLLPASHATYETCARWLASSAQWRRPVGVCFGRGGLIRDVECADQDVAKWFDEAEAEPVRISFRGHAGVYHLFHDHPDFARIYATAKRSAEHAEMLWFISSGSPLTLLDLVLSKDLPTPIYPKPNGVAP